MFVLKVLVRMDGLLMEQAAIILAMTWRAGQRQWYVFLISFKAFDQTCAYPENSVCGS